jgi:MFS family permease
LKSVFAVFLIISQNSAASAGLATGGFLIAPLAHKFGRSSVILWSLFGSLAAQIWGSQMTGSDQYIPYIISRYVAGFFGFATSVVAPSNLFDIFYLHQRGRAFTILEIAMNLGASVGPTFSGFIAANQYWTTEYWWTIALLGAAIVIVFTCLEETGYDRKTLALNPIKPTGYWANRVATFLPGSKVVKKTNLKETVSYLSKTL